MIKSEGESEDFKKLLIENCERKMLESDFSIVFDKELEERDFNLVFKEKFFEILYAALKASLEKSEKSVRKVLIDSDLHSLY